MARPDLSIVAVIAVGGGLGSAARYQLDQWWPDAAHQLPYTTLAINLTGSLLLGMLVVAVTEVWRPHRLTRPFLSTGVLGGYTTFSTMVVQVRVLPVSLALAYLLVSVAGGLILAAFGMSLIRKLEPHLARTSSHEPVDPIDPDLP